jgi:hypothetical protein
MAMCCADGLFAGLPYSRRRRGTSIICKLHTIRIQRMKSELKLSSTDNQNIQGTQKTKLSQN